MKYKLSAYEIWEYGQRVDEAGRPHQEDSVYPPFGQNADESRLFILCDGMGGHDKGEVASSTVCEAMSAKILAECPDPEGAFSDADLQAAIDAAYDALDARDTSASAKKMGTTMTLLKLHEDGATVAHMGDSRVYQIRPGATAAETSVVFRTRDHSLVNDLVTAGELTEEEARHSRQKNVITRAMQPNAERRMPAEINHLSDIRSGDYFYMCSDGMLENMDDAQLCYFFSQAAGNDLERVDKLIKATTENHDNHSAIIVHITDVIGEPVKPMGGDDKPAGPNPIIAPIDDDSESTVATTEVTTPTPAPAPAPAPVANQAAPQATPKPAQPQPQQRTAQRPAKRNVSSALLAVVMILALAIGAAAAWWFMQNKNDAPDQDNAPQSQHQRHQQRAKSGGIVFPDAENSREVKRDEKTVVNRKTDKSEVSDKVTDTFRGQNKKGEKNETNTGGNGVNVKKIEKATDGNVESQQKGAVKDAIKNPKPGSTSTEEENKKGWNGPDFIP